MYLNANTATVLEVTFCLVATKDGVEIFTPSLQQSVAFNGGRYWSHANNYVCSVPLNLNWVFGGSYFRKPGAAAPGRVNTPYMPERIENFLTAGTWVLEVYVSVIAYNPGANTMKSCITHVNTGFDGSVITIPGAKRYDPPIAAF